MKRIVLFLAALLASAAMMSAQTPEEIIKRMDEVMEKADKSGMAMTMDITMPIIGKASTRMYMVGEKTRADMSYKDKTGTVWMDETTSWDYDPAKNEITIENRKPSDNKSDADNAEMLKGITEGYDVTLTNETADAWYFDCKKSKSNTNKDDPKKMKLVVAKGSYLPIELTAKMKGVTVSIKDVTFDVKESDVTYDPNKFPGAKITDKR